MASIFKRTPSRGAPGHGKGYKYKKRFNATVTVSAGGASLPANPDSFAGTYGGGGRPAVALDSVVIEEGDVYGHLYRATVTFTCFTVGVFRKYESRMLQLGADCSISVGYAESGAPGGGKTFSNMFIYKFDWSLTKDNYVKCSFSAMSATPLIDDHPINTQARIAEEGLTFKAVQEAGGEPVDVPVQSISQYMMFLAQGAGQTPTEELQPGFSNGILILNNPLTKTADDPEFNNKVINGVNSAGANLSLDNSKLVYCTLGWLVHIINEKYMPTESDRLSGIKYYIGSTAINAGIPGPSICSSDPFSILIAGNGAGDYGEASGAEPEQQLLADQYAPAAQKGDSIDCGNILLSASYLATKVFGDSQSINSTSDSAKDPGVVPEKPSFTFAKMFKTIFDDIYRVTGGAVHLVTLSNPDNSGDNNRYIEAMNHNDGDKPSPAVFDPFSGDQAIRSCEISCAPASKDAYAVAMKNRADSAGAAGVNGETVAKSGAFAAANQAINDARQKGLVNAQFSSAACDGLRQQLAKYVSSAGTDEVRKGKVPHQSAQFPLSLQLVTDGVTGFRFGDLITTTLNGAGQNGSTGCFVITKIIHTIQQNDWETKFETNYMLI